MIRIIVREIDAGAACHVGGDGWLEYRFYSGDDYGGRTELLAAAIDADAAKPTGGER